ncbi:hypothetical protein VitviT2T_026818 [Vitis vinifera]|uniref:DUF4216 domain-containing protein n=1 Tax=Vitis vinifera TaxID=29760 RepID=A0ABY9DQ12_VITVI|nr:hypothetical protein VitviT2T_026818 [Vitis vinifera]
MQMKILRHQGSPEATDELYSLASGPDRRVSLYHSCVVNGIRFHTKDRDDRHITQNSGVLVLGDHYEDMIDFYGVLLNVVVLDYIFNNQVVLFKCEWFDTDPNKKRLLDDGVLRCINVDNKWYEEDPYVLASQAQQIFYVNDPKLGSSWKVVQKVLHRHIFDVPEQTTTNDSENDNEDPTIEEAYQENDSTDIVWSVNQDCNVLQYQRADGDPSYIDIENVVDHGRRFENDDLTAFINDQDEEDDTLVDYCSEDNENSDEEDHDSDSDMQAMSCAICQSFEHLVEECPILLAAREMFGMPCGICQSFEHLVEECPIIPVTREIFGDYNTYNSNCRNHPNFFWEPQPRQYMQPAQTPHQALKLEQAIVNLTKVVEDFVAHHKSIIDQFKQDNAQVRQEIDSQEKKMDGRLNDLSQKIDNLEYSSSRLINLNTEREKENSPSQPHQNQKGIHEMEAKESDKEVDLPTCKLEHKEESEIEKEKREEIKGKKKGKSTEEDDYDVNVQGSPQRIVIKEEMMKNHIPAPFPQALYGKIIQSKSQVRDANFIWDPSKLNQNPIF